MTKDQARIVILKSQVEDMRNLVEFLHNCLVKPSNGEMNGGYSYEYPEHTEERLKQWNKAVPPRPYCHHSRFQDDCPSCRYSKEQRQVLHEAKEVLGSETV